MKTQSKKITENNIFIKLYLAKEKHWLRTILLLSASGCISFTFTIFNKLFPLEDGSIWSNIFSILSLILFFVLFIISVFIQISDVVYNKYLEATEKKTEKDLNFNLNFISNINKVCREKLHTLIEIISKVKSEKIVPPPHIINKPCNQLRKLSEAISNTIDYSLNRSDSKDHGENDVRVNIFYKLVDDNSTQWELVDNNNFEYNNIDNIVKNNNSLFNYAIKQDDICIMENNKQVAYNERRYVCCGSDSRDQEGNLNGSILYYKMPIKDKKGITIIEVVTMVYTCNKKFADDDIKAISNAKYNIETVLIRFLPRIQIEMCLYYLYYLRKKHNQNTVNQ